MTAIDLLKQSESEHERAKGLRKAKQPVEARIALSNARELRLDALLADPDMTDPEWQNERYPHADLLAFYSLQLGD